MSGPVADYVRGVGQKIAVQSGGGARATDYTVTLLNSNVNNAFAIPGGYVYITRQLLALMNDEAELAFVMGHEVAHVAARHGQKRQNRAALSNVLAGVAGVLLVTGITYTVGGLGLASTLALVTGVQLLAGFGLEAASSAGRELALDPVRLGGAALIVLGVYAVVARGPGA